MPRMAYVIVATIVAVAGSWCVVDHSAKAGETGLHVKRKQCPAKTGGVTSLPRGAKKNQGRRGKAVLSNMDDWETFYKSALKDAKTLDIYTITRFGRLLKEQCQGILGLKVFYGGPLIRPKFGQIVQGQFSDYLAWDVVGRSGLVICSVSIRLEKSNITLLTCEIEGRKLYVSVGYVSDPEPRQSDDIKVGLDTPIKELSFLTVREFLQPLASKQPLGPAVPDNGLPNPQER